MTLLSTYHYLIGPADLPLSTFAHGVQEVAGLDQMPRLRRRQTMSAHVDGTTPDPAAGPLLFGPKMLNLSLWISGTDANGAVTHANGQAGHVQDNLDALWQIIGAGEFSIKRLVPDGAGGTRTLTNTARVVGDLTPAGSKGLRRLRLPLELTWPFWRDATTGLLTLGPFTGAQSFTPAGTARLADASFICTAAGRITHTQSGDFIEVTSMPGGASSVTIKLRPPRSVLTNTAVDARNVYNANRGHGLIFEPGALANLTITGTWQIDYYEAHH